MAVARPVSAPATRSEVPNAAAAAATIMPGTRSSRVSTMGESTTPHASQKASAQRARARTRYQVSAASHDNSSSPNATMKRV